MRRLGHGLHRELPRVLCALAVEGEEQDIKAGADILGRTVWNSIQHLIEWQGL